ncbi:MAG: DUF692 family multinuclear iron-containing protein [Pseudomonadota bacterium]
MVKIALPVSHHFQADARPATRLPDLADVLEYKNTKKTQALPKKPAVFHWNRGLVQENFRSAFFEENLPEFLAAIEAELFSFDLGPACRKNQYVLPLSPTLDQEDLKTEFARSLDLVRKHYSGPLAAENYNYYPTGLYEHICRPDFIAASLIEFDLGLILDLAHAWVSAVNLGLTVADYLAELPLEKVREIHLSRPYFHPRTAVDAHQAPETEDFALLSFTLGLLPHPRNVLVAIEYYQDLPRLEQAYLTLNDLLSKFGRKSP